MTVCYECTERANHETPGVVHVDNTARPQVIARPDNPLYYDIVREYFALTGIPTIINTSFNNHEEPIVCSPEDAIKSLLIDNVDYVVMESHVVSRTVRG
jgi:carbamoyltransferase